ncbi:MAG: tetratricopeptide repeat protein [Desulfobulbaceae bacterium]|nr:tetratricopeptide repeat protein [Desulfobulbaceae bacterium]
MTLLRPYLLIFICFLLGSCSFNRSTTSKPPEENGTDLSCSYFYFLWGSHAETNEHYGEALEAYQKALICDPDADYVNRKIPILLLKMGKAEKAISWLQQAIKEQPDAIPLSLFLANLYAQQNKSEKAITLYDKVLALEPGNEDVQLRLTFLYIQQDRYEKAEHILRNLLKKNEEHYFAHFYLARLLKKTKSYKDAAVEYEKAISLNWSKDLSYEIGHFYTTLNQHEDALRIYTTITEYDPYDERASISRIQSLLELNRNDEALADLEQIRLFSQNKANIDLIAAKIFIRLKEPEKARERLLPLSQNTENSEAHYLLALLLFQDDEYAPALNQLRLVTPQSDIFEESVYLQTRIFKKLNEPDKITELLQKHISTPENSSPLFYALLSSLYQEQEKISEALTLLEEAIEIYHDNPQIFFEYGLLLERNGMSQQAVINMEKVLKLQPNHAEALNFIGYTWADSNIHLDRALEYIKRAVELKPENGYITDSLGWVYFRLGKLEKAETELKHAIELEPEDPHILDHLGDVYLSLKKEKKALQIYQKAYEMFKDEKKRAMVKNKIDALGKKLEPEL